MKPIVLSLSFALAACGGPSAAEVEASLAGTWASDGTPAYAQEVGWSNYSNELTLGADHRYAQQTDLTYGAADALRAGCTSHGEIAGTWTVTDNARGLTLAPETLRETLSVCANAAQNGTMESTGVPPAEFLVDVDGDRLMLSRADDDRVDAYVRQ